MSDVKDKIISKMNELIEEADVLKNEISNFDDARVDTWRMRATKLLERVGGEKLVREFNRSGAFSINMRASERERFEYTLKAIEGRKNCLIVIAEDLEFFDDKDEEEIAKIKHKIEAGVNVGFFKGKYTQERESK